ncbi:MAG: hypothetical protein KYX66_04850 [Blastomonas fulva]|uniref:hypothetical protein n=1 Tax=Blastomonas fulva TaxID=1550728 RepID=UPI0024E219DC|nr:hypothetical protein [Blastomonas fulva]MDK2756048.1 hypothetical protein [Blastomonas fulva]
MTQKQTMASATRRPDFIGTCNVRGEISFYGATAAEIDRSAFTLTRVLRTFGFAPGSNILTISMVPEIIQYGGFERAVQMLGLYGLNADDSLFDAGRVESISRQFNPAAICGVAASTLEGLRMFGHDVATVFAGRTVWARPDAFEQVSAMADVDARRVVSIGPVLALECAHGSLHYDSRDWTIVARDGVLRLTSRYNRIEPLDDLDTGHCGSVSVAPCTCGTRDGVVVLA